MEVYIRPEWLINQDNLKAVAGLISKHYASCTVFDPDRERKVAKGLDDLGETIIKEMFLTGALGISCG